MMSAIRTASRLLAAAVLACTFAAGIHAQPTEVLFERIKLPRSADRAGAIAQDQQGFMWFATNRGLVRYDGHNFTVYGYERFRGGDRKHFEAIWHLRADTSGGLWIASSNGLHRFDTKTDETISYRHDPDDPNSLSHDVVWLTIEDRNGIVWIATEIGLDRFDPAAGTFKSYRHDPDDPTSLTPGVVWSLYEDREGTIWVGTGPHSDLDDNREGGLNRFDPDTETFTRYLADPADESTLARPNVKSIYEDSQGRFWVGTGRDGLHSMDREHGTFTQHRYDPRHPTRLSRPVVSAFPPEYKTMGTIRFVHEDQMERLWIGAHSGGINVYDRELEFVAHYEADQADPTSLASNRIWTIAESRDGVMWIGTFTHTGWPPLHKAIRVPPIRFFAPDSIITAGNRVSAIHESADGTLWVGTENRGLIRFETTTGSATHYRFGTRKIPVYDRVNSIQEADDGRLWLAGYGGGLILFDPVSESTQHFFNDSTDTQGLAWQSIRATHLDENGDLWIGTRWNGLARFDPETGDLVYYANDPDDPHSLGDAGVNRIHQSGDGSLWLGTHNGLNRLDRESGKFDRFLMDRAWRGPINGIIEDRSRILWVSWNDGSLARFDPETNQGEYIDTKKAGLPGNEIASIIADDVGNLWVRTDEAIARFDADDRRFYSYSTIGDETFLGAGAGAHKNQDGDVYFGGHHGIHAFDPEEVLASENHVPPQAVISGFYLFDEKVEPGSGSPLKQPLPVADEIELPYDQNVFSFDLAALHYLNPERNRLVYFLDGFDLDWREAGPDQRASYYRVPHGDYVFRVKAANPFGVWSTEEASIRMAVLPPWWLTWWAYLLYACLIASALWGLHASRVRRLETRAAELGVLVQERTRDLEEEKEKTEQQAMKLVELSAEKDRFFFNISHEFRTPLTLILGPIEDAIAGVYGDVGPRLHQHLLTVRRNGRKLHRLISQLLDLSKLEFGRMPLRVAERDLVPFVRFIVLSFAPLAERRGITLTFKSDANELPAFVDADKLEHVVTNLLSNAFKFTSEHGKILVAVSRIAGESREFAEISVMDTGTGIPSEELPFIFDRFHQADSLKRKTGEGTGIGLSLAKELVELHHGEIRAESREGFGTTFFVRLPLGKDHFTESELASDVGPGDVSDLVFPEPTWISETGPAELTDGGDGSPQASGRPTVVIVEDNPDVREFLREHLAESYDTVVAVDGADGLEKVQQVRPDLVLADVMMPRMDGYQLCQAIKTDDRFNHIPVVLLTARASEDAEIEGLEAGADDYIYKPFSAEALMARMENLIEIRNLLRRRFSGEVTIKSTGATVESADAVFLGQVRDAAEAHLGDSSFTVEWLADDVGVSARQLRRKLRELLNLSPGGYIRMLRLERAAQLLEQKAGNVSEVAYKVGFNDPRYFSRLFSQTFGVAPSSYPQGKT